MSVKYSLPLLISASLLLTACNETNSPTAGTKSANTPPAETSTPTEQTGTDAKPQDGLVRVNDDIIDIQTFALYQRNRQSKRPGNPQDPQQQIAALDELVNFVLLRQDAEAKGLESREDVVAALRLQRAQLLAQAAVQNYMAQNQPNEEAVQERYQAMFSEPTRELKARHILVETDETARSVIKELDDGGDFAELAKQHSTGPTGVKGGDLGWFATGKMVKPFSDAAAGLEKGSYTKDPVQTQFGWHVILLEDTREVPAPELEKVKPQILLALQQKALANYMSTLRSSAKIEMLQPANPPPAQSESPIKVETFTVPSQPADTK